MASSRRERILQLVAEDYIGSAHPVPSAAVAERLSLSSATVRKEFAWLEDQGLLQQPHTSAGRIPTALGFRAYAARYIPPRPMPVRARERLWRQLRGLHGEAMLRRLAEVAAELSGYAVVIELSLAEWLHSVEIHLSPLTGDRLMAVVVLENGLTRELVVPVEPAPSDDVLDDAERNLRQLGLPMAEVPSALRDLAGRAEDDLGRTLRALAEAWPRLTPRQVVSHGLTRLFDEPEARDPDFVKRAARQLEGTGADVDGPADDALQLDLDDALARISSGLDVQGLRGRLMVVGPARMRYPVALTVVHGLSRSEPDDAVSDAS